MNRAKVISENDLSAILLNRVGHRVVGKPKLITIENAQVFGNIILIAPLPPNNIASKLTFINCTLKGNIELGSHENAGSIEFNNCVFEGNVKIESLGNVKFIELCHFYKNFSIYLNGMSIKANISNIIIDGDFEIAGSEIENLSLSDINSDREIREQRLNISSHSLKTGVLKNIRFANVEVKKTIFHSSILLEEVTTEKLVFESVVVEGLLHVENVIITKEFNIENAYKETGHFKISGSSQINSFSFSLEHFRRISISDCTINELQISDSNKKEDILNIEKTTLKRFIFKDVYNNGLITLRGLIMPKDGVISIKSSNIGKTDFIKCDFSKSILEFENSKITEVFFAGTNFPKKVRLENLKNHGQAQLAFGQLQTAFQKQGDTLRSLEYQSREIEAHYYGLKFWSKDFFKTLNLSLNLISNNFGQYWALGIFFTFSIGLLFFIFLLVSTDKYQFGVPKFDCHLIPAYLKFMNPLRFIETDSLFKSNPDLKLKDWSYLWDFLGRVFVAYGAYQTIQAFRRFGRK